MTAMLSLTLPCPPSANRYWTVAPGRGLVPTAAAMDYKARVRKLLLTKAKPIVGDVVISGVWYRPRRIGDLNNTLKVLEDALNGLAWLDDAQISAVVNYRRDDSDPKNARIELEIIGERFATAEEAKSVTDAKAARADKARRTVNQNRLKKKLRLAGHMFVSAVTR